MAEKDSFWGQKRGFSYFVLHVKRRRRGLEVKRPFDLYWWEELNFGQEPVFLEVSVQALPQEAVLLPRIVSLLLAACGNSSNQ